MTCYAKDFFYKENRNVNIINGITLNDATLSTTERPPSALSRAASSFSLGSTSSTTGGGGSLWGEEVYPGKDCEVIDCEVIAEMGMGAVGVDAGGMKKE